MNGVDREGSDARGQAEVVPNLPKSHISTSIFGRVLFCQSWLQTH